MKLNKTRRWYLWRFYGITEDQYQGLLQKQDNRCGVCRRPSSSFRNFLCVDHDHKTGRIRGLLCIFCNRYVIGKHRDASLFEAAAEYLRSDTDLYVPKRKRRKRLKKWIMKKENTG